MLKEIQINQIKYFTNSKLYYILHLSKEFNQLVLFINNSERVIDMKQLFEEVKLHSGATLKNRLLMAPMTTQSAYFDGRINQGVIDYYKFRSGDAAAVIVESCFVENEGRGFSGAVGIDTDDKIPGLTKLAKAIKEEGSKAIVQIYHAGRMAWPNLNGGATPIAPSPVAALRPNAPVPREMTDEQIIEMVQLFVDATRRAIQAGFDGVELHGANTFILQQFFSPHSNRRHDRWGGSREKRMTFIREVVQEVKAVVRQEAPANFIIGYRFSPEELEEPGIRFEDTMYMLNELAKYDLDYFHFSMGSYQRSSIVHPESSETLIKQYHAMKSEELATIPIIGVGAILQRADAEDALQLGYDLLTAGKAFLIEPDWVNKLKANEPIPTYAAIHQQEELLVPDPLWSFMDYMIVDPEEEQRKYERLKELQNIKLTFTPGTYTVMSQGHNDPIPMNITFSKDRLERIEVDNSNESEGLSDQVFEQIPKQVIEGQTLNVDVVSGASVSSQGVIDGIAEAVALANGNAEVMRARPKPKVEWVDEVVISEADVVVIGGGAAGMAAALRADQLGQKVCLIEKRSFLGGAISISGGNQVVSQSQLQAKAGVDYDTAESVVTDFKANGDGSNDPELLALLAENVGEATDWVHDYMHVDYNLDEGLHRLGEYSVDRELAYVDGGHGFAASARQAVEDSGIDVLLQTCVNKITTDESGTITGVIAQEDVGRVHYISAKAVVITTGGYGNNPALLSDELKQVLFYGPSSATGDGVTLTTTPEINAAVRAMEKGKIYPNGVEVAENRAKSTIGGNIAVFKENALLVNTSGHRVVNERASNYQVLEALMKQPDKMLYILMDQDRFNIFREEIAEGGISASDIDRWVANDGQHTPYVFKANDLYELAIKAGMELNALAETVTRYNSFVKAGEDTDFHRPKENLQVDFGQGPYYLVEQKPRFATTLGGLVVNKQLQVLNKDGAVIQGLFAAGETVGGVMGSDSPSGANNAWALTSGKLASEQVAATVE